MAKKKTTPKGKLGSKETSVKSGRAAPGKTKSTTVARGARSMETGKDGSAGYAVLGTVSYPDKSPAVGLRIIAFDKDIGGADVLGSAVTDDKGHYRIEYSDADFRRSPKESRGADVFVRVLAASGEQLFESKARRNAPGEYALDISLPGGQFVVRGTVLDSNNAPLGKMLVRAFDRDLRIPQLLGTGETNLAGDYRIAYGRAGFLLGDSPSRRAPWLIVEVLETPEGEVLARQEVPRAAPDQTISFTLARTGAASEWESISETVAPLLKGQGMSRVEMSSHASTSKTPADLAAWELTAGDVDFIVQDAEADRAAVEAWVASSRMAREAGHRLDGEHLAEQQLLRESGWPFFFAMARQGVGRDLSAVLKAPAARWRQAWIAARSSNYVPAIPDKRIELLVGVLDLLLQLQQIDPAQGGDNPIGQVLAGMSQPLPRAVALDALAIVREKGMGDADALLGLVSRHPDAEASIKSFVRGVRVHQLVSGDAGLFNALNARLEGRTSDSLAPLAAMSSREWMDVADEAAASSGLALRLHAQVELEHPLVALQARVDSGNVKWPGASGGELAALMKKDGATVASILTGKKPVKDSVGGQETPAVLKALRDIGRFLRAGVGMELAGYMQEAGIKTPATAIRYGREYIREQYREKLPKEAADEVVDRFFGTIEPLLDGANGFVIGAGAGRHLPASLFEENKVPLPESLRENLPSLPGLFGDLDECICRPCESMLGQPAYLVDLLNLLGKTPAAFARLESRRPDITELKLSCENAETKIEHIDIVLEILEKAVEPAAGSDPYLKTANALFPWSLPFSLPYARTRAFLARLGVARTRLQALRTGTPPAQWAAETFGMGFERTGSPGSASEWELITHRRSGNELWSVYGFDSASHISIVDPASGERLEDKTVQDLLARVSVLLDRAGLELEELESLLATRYVGGGSQPGLSNREQCKTSVMRLDLGVADLEVCLDRMHRFMRLRRKCPDWSIGQLDAAIVAVRGLERLQTTDGMREAWLARLAIVKRLCDEHGIPIDYLINLPASIDKLRESLGLSARQFIFLKVITALDPAEQPLNWPAIEAFCKAAGSIRESGLTLEQVAEALLTRDKLIELSGELPPSVRTNAQIESLLTQVQERLRSVVAIRSGLTLEAQSLEALSAIYDAATAERLVRAIREAGDPRNPTASNAAALLPILRGDAGQSHAPGTWLPLVSAGLADRILTIDASTNLSADARFRLLLEAVAARRRERELILAIAGQCGLSESDAGSMLGSWLLLDADGNNSTNAAEVFLDAAFWTGDPPPAPTVAAVPRLHAWMDRLHRLVSLGAALGLDTALMTLASRVAVGAGNGINWRDMLAAIPSSAGGAWPNPNWQALLDLIWLQRPESISRQVLGELLDRLEGLGTGMVSDAAVRPLATRVEIAETQTLAIAAQAVSPVSAMALRDPTLLRRAFELLQIARQLGADADQLDHLANSDDNAGAAAIAARLLQEGLSEEAWPVALQGIEDRLRQQRRDAAVACLVHRDSGDGLRDANDLYERYLIDPQMEPCFETTRLLEATTATQLFVQRVLFGMEEGIIAGEELRQRWTWMRNYRVWEANRKVFLFPENWLFPELRDDKSSSFSQLESALGQGELTQDLARQSFGQFLDDVAQMGQVEVLGMYEDMARAPSGNVLRDEKGLPVRRTLYVIGRSQNPPYAYFWRQCLDFGSPYMEWSPWQRIELDIQGDHVLPFVLGGSLHVAWPLIREIKGDSREEWEVKLAWSRHDGKSWKKSSVSRDFWRAEVEPFAEEREGFSFRCETSPGGDLMRMFVYALAKIAGATKTKLPTITGAPQVFFLDASYWPSSQNDSATLGKLRDLINGNYANLPPATEATTASERLKRLVNENYPGLPQGLRDHLEVYMMAYGDWRVPPDPTSDLSGGDPLYQRIRGNNEVFSRPDTAIGEHKLARDTNNKALQGAIFSKTANSMLGDFLWRLRAQTGAAFINFMSQLGAACSRRTVSCEAWIRVTAPSGVDDLLVLDGSRGSYSCSVDGQNLSPGRHIDVTKLGPQAEASCSLTLFLNGTPFPSTTSEGLAAVPAGKSVSQTLRFEIDGRSMTEEQLRVLEISFDSMRTLSLVSEFRLTRDDWISRLDTSAEELGSQIESSQPWMNGFQEVSIRQDQPANPFKVLRPGYSDLTVFSPSAAPPFWAVGSATSSSHKSMPLAWHYSENGLGCYIDLGYAAGLPQNPVPVYPDSYREAALRRSLWSESQSLDDASLQVSTFGAEGLPVPAIGDAADWQRIKAGGLAFDASLPYACYNWEVFFHAPLLIADQLSKQHKFEDAERWLRYVFDPTTDVSGNDARRFLKFRVFKELDLNRQVIDDLTALAQVAGGYGTASDDDAVQKLISRWRDAPFQPFLIARRRHVAFLWRTLFAYLDNLIAWADSLYRQDTIESINEATMLYVLAERILGRRPQLHEGGSGRPAFSYKEKIGAWDDFANYWIDAGTHGSGYRAVGYPPKGQIRQPSPDGMLYFCMPFNDKILSYWDLVESRLSNVRNCRNIEGIKRTLPLMDAPIDPELLVRATAAGLDLGEVIAGLYAPPPHYRYGILAARAAELASECKALGAAMLSAIEKRDAEHLARLRSSNEISLLELVQEVRTLQITEAERNIDALRATRKSIGSRYEQYQRLLGNKDFSVPGEQESAGEESMLGSVDSALASNRSSLGLIKEENEQYVGFDAASAWSIAAGIARTAGGVAHIAAAPFYAGTVTEPAGKALTATGHALSAAGDAFTTVSQAWRSHAEQQGMLAGHLRRRDEWAFQSNQALKELQQVDKQILANQIRIDVTKKELGNHIEQIEQAKAIDEVMRSKFSNEELYEWMRTQLYGLYSNTYRMALEMARRAERSAARELGVTPLNILRNDHWDSLRDGLLAGERLHQDIKRLETTFLDENRREYELTRNISLRRLDPQALARLRIQDGDGLCVSEFKIPEWLFDLDTPGHYLRRIRSVSLSIPCIVGPYASVNCKLTLLESSVRHDQAATSSNYLRSGAGDDSRFTDYFGASEAIVTSTGSGDSGLFEAQLRDERFLPFEGSGVISRWRLELPGQYPQFDYSTISDVVLNIRYTARDGGDVLRDAATSSIAALLKPPQALNQPPMRIPVVLGCRSDFPVEWARAGAGANLEIPVSRNSIPYWVDAVRPKLTVREVAVADLPTSPLSFRTVWPPTTGGAQQWVFDVNGVKTVDLGAVPDGVTDRMVLLWMGSP